MKPRLKGISAVYDMDNTVARSFRPLLDGGKKNKAAKKASVIAQQERKERQTLKRARRYLLQTLTEREELERAIAASRSYAMNETHADRRLQNLIGREQHLRAAIARLGGDPGSIASLVELGTPAHSDSAPSLHETTVLSLPEILTTPEDDVEVPLPAERQRLDGVIYNSRDGQGIFREQVLAAYCRCALTGCEDRAALQAAHIIPYVNAASNLIRNGICFRGDIHLLFDRGLIQIDQDYRATISETLRWSEYRALHNRKLDVPHDETMKPGKRLLAIRHKYL